LSFLSFFAIRGVWWFGICFCLFSFRCRSFQFYPSTLGGRRRNRFQMKLNPSWNCIGDQLNDYSIPIPITNSISFPRAPTQNPNAILVQYHFCAQARKSSSWFFQVVNRFFNTNCRRSKVNKLIYWHIFRTIAIHLCAIAGMRKPLL